MTEQLPTPTLNQSDQADTVDQKERDLCALDEMFGASRHYRNSKEYMELLEFVSKFRRHAPFNGMLLHIQNPSAVFVASMREWAYKFGRSPKRDARPLVILQPFGPVRFVYDLEETEGKPVPDYVLKPFDTKGKLPKGIFEKVIHNCGVHGIDIRDDLKCRFDAGMAVRLGEAARKKFEDLEPSPDSNYLILLNVEHSLEEKYSTLAHELGHIFCGHLGIDELAWWEGNANKHPGIMEIEAESVAFLVCMRQGLRAASERYLSDYQTDDIELPSLGLNAVLQATDYIEKMGKSRWEKPLKKPKKEG
jgi:hypothetical protein